MLRQMSSWAMPKNKDILLAGEENTNGNSNPSEEEIVTDDLQVPLMCSILLYSTTGINSSLKRPDLVDKIQNYYLTKLHRYLKYRCGENQAMHYLTKGMKVASMAREAQHIWSQRLPI